ncbi:MAG: hypothetical protein Q9223_007047 [Gallowayella weberi]
MDQDYSEQTTGSDEDKGRVPAEHGGEAKLDERADDGRCPWCVRVRQDKFVEVVNVCYAEVKRGEKDDTSSGEWGQKVQWHKEGAEQDLFRHRPGNVIPPADPAAEALVQRPTSDPVLPSALHHGPFEKRTGEKHGGQDKTFGYLDGADWMPAKHAEDVEKGSIGAVLEDIEGCYGGECDGDGDKAYPCSDDGGSITGQGWRWSSGRREIEWEYIKDDICDLTGQTGG